MNSDVSDSLIAAASDAFGTHPLARLVVQGSRVFQDTLLDSNAPIWADDGVTSGSNPIPQDSEYIIDRGIFVSASEIGGELCLSTSSSGSSLYPEIGGSRIKIPIGNRPALLYVYFEVGAYDDIYKDYRELRVYYHDHTSGSDPIGWTTSNALVDIDKLLAGNPDCLSDIVYMMEEDNYSDNDYYCKGSLYAIATDTVARVYLDEGGIGVDFLFGGENARYEWQPINNAPPYQYDLLKRIMFNTAVTSEYATCHAAAGFIIEQGCDYYDGYPFNTKTLTYNEKYKVYIYVSDPVHGSVKGIYWDWVTGEWSDPFDAIPSDLSSLYLANAISAGNRIFLNGQFERKEELDMGVTRNLVLQSDETGKYFAFDRFSMYSNLGYRFIVGVKDDKFWGCASGRTILDDATYFFTDDPTGELIIPGEDIVEINSSTGDNSGDISVVLSNGDEAYSSNPLVIRGSRVLVQLGYKTENGDEYYSLMSTTIAAKKYSVKDAVRNLVLRLTPDGVWKTTTNTYPFYIEMIGKSSQRSAMASQANFYPADGSANGYITDKITCDLWESEGYSNIPEGISALEWYTGDGISPYQSPLFHKWGVQTADFQSYLGLLGYPEIVDDDIYVDIYGWSHPSTTSSGSIPFDVVTPRLMVIDADGVEREVCNPVLVSTDDHFPSTYGTSGSGSYPIRWKFNKDKTGDEFVTGETIRRAALTIQATCATYVYIERIEITGVQGVEPASTPDLTELATVDSIEIQENIEYTIDIMDSDADGSVKGQNFGYLASPTSGWKDADFDDSSWPIPTRTYTTVGLFGPSFYGAMVGDDDPVPSRICFRLKFELPAGATVTEAYGNSGSPFYAAMSIIAHYVNGNDRSSLAFNNTMQYPVEDFIPGTNVIAIDCWSISRPGDWPNALQWWFTIKYTMSSHSTTDAEEAPEENLFLENPNNPVIIYATRPFTAFNFQAWGEFEYTPPTIANPLCDTYYGIVGHGKDARNYTMMRYSNITGKMQLVKVRNGSETILKEDLILDTIYNPWPYEEQIPHVYTGKQRMYLMHNDGLFRYGFADKNYDLRDSVISDWHIPVDGHYSYRWTEADGDLCPDDEYGVMHVGYYYYNISPRFLTCGYNPDDCAGVLPLPGEDMTMYDALPSSGTIILDGRKYTYTKTSGASMNTVGPYQARNTNTYGGNVAWEITWFDWTKATGALAGQMIASDNLHSHVLSSSLWQVAHTAGQYLLNRSRHYSPTINGDFVGFPNRMFIGNGLLLTDTTTTGASGRTCSYRTPAYVDFGSRVKTYDFAASSGDLDQSLEDMIKKICAFSGTRAEFPGNVYEEDVYLSSGVGRKIE